MPVLKAANHNTSLQEDPKKHTGVGPAQAEARFKFQLSTDSSLVQKAVPFISLSSSIRYPVCLAHHQSGRSDCAGSGVVFLLPPPRGPGSPPGSPSGYPPSHYGCQ